MCISPACEADIVAVEYEYTEERCIELGVATYGELGYTFFCAKDKTSLSAWETFE